MPSVPQIPLSRTIELEWPVTYRGKRYDSIAVRRDPAGKGPPSPDCPPAVFMGLDADDALRLWEAARALAPKEMP